jgi:G3E family GTPase
MMSQPATIPVTVLTGFLGSGKTTVLNRLLMYPRLSDTAVIINEFGEIGLDHLLVTRSTENLILLNNGCLCCTVRGDLVQTLADLDARVLNGEVPPFRRVVIETTGLADPAPILHTIMVDPSVAPRWRLEGVITTVDAVNGARTLAAHDEALKQAAVADRILLTKSDIASSDDLAAVRRRLDGLIPATPIVDVIDGVVDPAAILDVGLYDASGKIADVSRWLLEEPRHAHRHHHHGHGKSGHHAHDVNRHDDRIRAHCIVIDTPVSWKSFAYWLELLAAMRGEQMLRVKGIIAIEDHPEQPFVIHGVQHVFHPPIKLDRWPSNDRRTRLVFITRDMEMQELERTLRKFGRIETSCSPTSDLRKSG